MTKHTYPIALQHPPELSLLLAQLPPSPHLAQSLLALHEVERETLAAIYAISQIDRCAAAMAYNTLQTAELLKWMQGWSPELEPFDEARRGQYLATMQELVAQAHTRILDRMKGNDHV